MMRKNPLKIAIDKKELTTLKEDAFIWVSFLICLAFIILTIGLILFNWNRIPPEVPLFYSRPWGEEQLASPWYLWALPTLTLLIIFFNLFLAASAFKKEIFIRRILATTGLIFSLLIFLTTYKIISLVN